MKHLDRVMDALERGERDAQLLDGRNFNAAYWRQARRSLSTLQRKLEVADSENEAFRAVLAAVPEENKPVGGQHTMSLNARA